MAFCKRLSSKEGVTYRLPTEAEWEYACHAGTMTDFSFGDEPKISLVTTRGFTTVFGRKLDPRPGWTVISSLGMVLSASEQNARIRGASTTCTVTSMSGARIGLEIMRSQRPSIRPVLRKTRTGWFAEGTGTAPHISAGRRTAPGTPRRCAVASWASVLPEFCHSRVWYLPSAAPACVFVDMRHIKTARSTRACLSTSVRSNGTTACLRPI